MSFWTGATDDADFDGATDQQQDDAALQAAAAGADRILLLIDAQQAMLSTRIITATSAVTTSTTSATTAPESHLCNCIRIAVEIFKSKIISGEKCAIGVSFFGVQSVAGATAAAGESAAENFDFVVNFIPLSPPSLEHLRKLQQLQQNVAAVVSQPAAAGCPLKAAFWAAAAAFKQKEVKTVDTKRIWIFTNDDNPFAAAPQSDLNTAMTVAKDNAQAGIELSVWGLHPSAEREFDLRRFYSELLRTTVPTSTPTAAANSNSGSSDDVNDDGDDEDSEEEQLQNRAIVAELSGFDMRMLSVRRKQHRKRRVCTVLFSLGSSTGISTGSGDSNGNMTGSTSGNSNEVPCMAVNVYKCIAVSKRPQHSWLYARTNAPLVLRSSFIDTATGAAVAEGEYSTFVEVASTRVPFSKDDYNCVISRCNAQLFLDMSKVELDKIPKSRVTHVGVELLYFLPGTSLPAALNAESSHFLFPDERTVAGSCALFEALLRQLAQQRRVAVVNFSRSVTTAPLLSVLLPQLEEVDADGCQIAPAGFWVQTLPYSDDLRANPAAAPVAALDNSNSSVGSSGAQLIAATSQLLQALRLPADFEYHRDVENPALQKFYSVLQAVALQQQSLEWIESRDDSMRPNSALLQSPEVQQLLLEVQKLTGLSSCSETEEKPPAAATKKRAAVGGSSGRGAAVKKPRP